ncbi:MAG TPA: tol-pal system protein YbgF [Caulobacteraceae bacterium]
MKNKTLTALMLAVMIGGPMLGVAASHAQTPLPMDEDPLSDRSKRRLDKMEKVLREMRAIVFQGRDTGKPVVVQFADTDERMALLAQRIADLEASLQRVNQQNETLRHDLDQTSRALEIAEKRLTSMNDRLAPLEDAAASAQQDAQAEAERAAQDPEEAFANAAGLMDGGDFDGAEAALADFVERHPDHARAAEANFLLGKAYAVRSAHKEAAASFIEAIRGYPKTSWAPEAMLELSKALIALKRNDDACATLATLAAKYPKPPAAVTKQAAAAKTKAKCAA